MGREAVVRTSVVITSYNYDRFVGQAIESALGQTLPPSEVIVVDDGSVDRSWEVIQSFGPKIVAVRQENAGQVAAVNAGVAMASGDVIFLLDSDDYFLPEKLEVVMNAVEPVLGTPFLVTHTRVEIKADGKRKAPATFSERARAIKQSLVKDSRLKLVTTPTQAYAHSLVTGQVLAQCTNTSNLAISKEMAGLVFPMLVNGVKGYPDEALCRVAAYAGNVYWVRRMLAAHRYHDTNLLKAYPQPRQLETNIVDMINELLVSQDLQPVIKDAGVPVG